MWVPFELEKTEKNNMKQSQVDYNTIKIGG